MLYPANYDIRLLQNSTWRMPVRVTQSARTITNMSVSAGAPTFTAECHGLALNDKVVITAANGTPCGLSENTIYHVISGGLTTSEFRLSATSGGSSISLTATADGNYPVSFTVAKPLDITGYTIDADIRETDTLTQIATFSISLTSAPNGSFELSLSPATTAALAAGIYGYDLYMTSTSGERYYYLRGSVTVERTLSRA